jgi:hypothetical protein
VPVQAATNAYALVTKGSTTAATRIDIPDKLTAPVSRLQKVGDIVKVDLVATTDVATIAPAIPVRTPGSTRWLLGGGALVGAIVYRGRSRRKVQRRFPTRR